MSGKELAKPRNRKCETPGGLSSTREGQGSFKVTGTGEQGHQHQEVRSARQAWSPVLGPTGLCVLPYVLPKATEDSEQGAHISW